MKLIFATNNQHKVDEIRSVLKNSAVEIVTLKEAEIDVEIPEPYDTLEENASNKSRTIFEEIRKHLNHKVDDAVGCFSEDTGLEVYALNGAPGVRSARYAGDAKSFDQNIRKLLSMLRDVDDRRARFRTVISLLIEGEERLFEGSCEGAIAAQSKGDGGFGYDPVFIPYGSVHTFAEMSLDEKNRFSHRRKATDKLVSYLNSIG